MSGAVGLITATLGADAQPVTIGSHSATDRRGIRHRVAGRARVAQRTRPGPCSRSPRVRIASPRASAPSPRRPPSPSTPRPRRCKAAGEPVIGFGAGEPDFPTPEHIVEAAVAACRDPPNHRYSPAGGLPELREAIAAKTARDSRLRGRAPARSLVTNGGKHAVYNTFADAARPGRRGAAAGAVLDHLPRADRGSPVASPFRSTAHRRRHGLPGHRRPARGGPAPTARRCWSSCRRRNPTGAVYPRDEIEAIGQWAVEHGIWVITDEIYEHLVYGDNEFHSMPALVPELADRCVVLNGVAKTYAMTGWRVGWMIGPPTSSRRPPTCSRTPRPTSPTSSQRAALAAVGGICSTPWPRCGRPSTGAARPCTRCSTRIDGVELPRAAGCVLRLPRVRGRARPRRSAAYARRPRSSWPR